ncbi:Hypp9196 [Branchiostoma lanceolatum]|uniref:Hypp9196 protein n=1 Tax=Branchiostoma lanceolatum TaxID=7740 RepID=A0A8J9ZEN6_BRALA|nr:Hypp9196 [Branchiostoma lanceolatum]
MLKTSIMLSLVFWAEAVQMQPAFQNLYAQAREKATAACPGRLNLMYEVNNEPADLVYTLACPEKADDCPSPDTVPFLTKVCLCCAEHKILDDCIFCTAFP